MGREEGAVAGRGSPLPDFRTFSDRFPSPSAVRAPGPGLQAVAGLGYRLGGAGLAQGLRAVFATGLCLEGEEKEPQKAVSG